MNAFSGHDQAKGCFSLNGGILRQIDYAFVVANDIKTPQHTRPQDWAHLPYFCRPLPCSFRRFVAEGAEVVLSVEPLSV